MGIPEEAAKVVIMEYWKEIYSNLISGKCSAVTARHLGTFAMSRYKLNNYIMKRIQKVKRMAKSLRLTDEQKEEYITNEKEKISKALVHRNDIAWQYAKNFKNV